MAPPRWRHRGSLPAVLFGGLALHRLPSPLHLAGLRRDQQLSRSTPTVGSVPSRRLVVEAAKKLGPQVRIVAVE